MVSIVLFLPLQLVRVAQSFKLNYSIVKVFRVSNSYSRYVPTASLRISFSLVRYLFLPFSFLSTFYRLLASPSVRLAGSTTTAKRSFTFLLVRMTLASSRVTGSSWTSLQETPTQT
uniref:Putative secreted protein n=1 Tax=Ixodes ricinus TaxID=34613 RepID=A0A090XER9_IXORI